MNVQGILGKLQDEMNSEWEVRERFIEEVVFDGMCEEGNFSLHVQELQFMEEK